MMLMCDGSVQYYRTVLLEYRTVLYCIGMLRCISRIMVQYVRFAKDFESS